MPKKPLEAIDEYFSQVTDPRVERTKEHKLIDMIAIAICAVICGAEGWTDIGYYSAIDMDIVGGFGIIRPHIGSFSGKSCQNNYSYCSN